VAGDRRADQRREESCLVVKTLVVASGKGGTGKTTLSALFARFAGPERPLVVADCDVEASNLPLALRAETLSREAFPGGEKAVVDEDLCSGCETCVDSCRFEAISLVYGAARVDEWSCEGCGACAAACPSRAISMEPRQAGELLTGTGSSGVVVFGRLSPGQDLSGKLVTAVRERAKALAEKQGADLVLVDGPPGVGCPVIASISGADGLLAVAEPSLSGEHDLRRLASLARQLRVPVKVVLNKADLSLAAAERVRRACREEELELIGEVPFDDRLPSALERMARGDGSEPSPGVEAAGAIWKRLESWMADWRGARARAQTVVQIARSLSPETTHEVNRPASKLF
jgi:MinD superfamily P-loop ATPase